MPVKQTPLGSFEVVSFPEFDVRDVVAKIDTGAYTGALHATDIHESKDAEGRKVVSFVPYADGKAHQTAQYRKKRVRSSNGELEERYVISTVIVIAGKERKINISLSDRSQMMKGVLIGRQFLRRYHYLVDVRLGTAHRFKTKEDE